MLRVAERRQIIRKSRSHFSRVGVGATSVVLTDTPYSYTAKAYLALACTLYSVSQVESTTTLFNSST